MAAGGGTRQLLAGAGGTRQLLAVAVQAAERAAAVLPRRAGEAAMIGHKSSDTDPVTDADLAAEAAIAGLLARARPGDGLLGEEGTAREGRTGLRWVVDPLDGTVNARYGLPHFAVSIACEQRIEPGGGEPGGWRALVAAVHDPTRGEMFTAVLGGGARLGGRPLAVNDPVASHRALVATGFSYHASSRARQARALAPLLDRVRDIRSLGSAALALCWLAAGRCDAYYEDELAPWDQAAGALIAREAGATVTGLGTGVLAAGSGLHPELAAAIPSAPVPAAPPHRGSPITIDQKAGMTP